MTQSIGTMLGRATILMYAMYHPENKVLQKQAEEVHKLNRAERDQEKSLEQLGKLNPELIEISENKKTLLDILGLRRTRFS